MLRREAAPLYGRAIGALLSGTALPADPEAFLTLWPNRWQVGLGEELHTTWPAFLDVLAERRPWRGAHEHPGFSAASFSPMLRALGNIRSVGAVIARVQRGAASFAAVGAVLADVGGILYSTHEHRERANDFVIALPFSRPASTAEHRRAVRRVAGSFAARSDTKRVLVEQQPSAFCYLPSWVPGEAWHVRRLGGRFLDPSANPF